MRTTINGNPHQRILTTKDIAALFGVHEMTIAEWRRKKIGPPYYKVNRKCQYREEDVMEWLEGNKREG